MSLIDNKQEDVFKELDTLESKLKSHVADLKKEDTKMKGFINK